MNILITLAIGILLGAVATYLILSSHMRNKMQDRLDRHIASIGLTPPPIVNDDCDCVDDFRNIEQFIRNQYMRKSLVHPRSAQEFHENASAVRAFIRWIHGAGCTITVQDSAQHDVEREPNVVERAFRVTTKIRNNRFERSINKQMGVR